MGYERPPSSGCVLDPKREPVNVMATSIGCCNTQLELVGGDSDCTRCPKMAVLEDRSDHRTESLRDRRMIRKEGIAPESEGGTCSQATSVAAK